MMSYSQLTLDDALTVGFALKATMVAVVGFTGVLAYRHRVLSRDLPPSPPATLPFLLGHITAMPKDYQWETYGAWAKTLGNMIYMSILGQPILILNSVDDARALMDKRGAIYSDRPRAVLLGELYGQSNAMGFLPYGDQFRAQRRMLQQGFSSKAVRPYRDSVHEQLRKFLRKLVNDETCFVAANKHYISANIVKATYGRDVEAGGDRYMQLAVEFGKSLVSNDTAGSHPVDIAPILRHYPAWLPLGSFQRKAAKAKQQLQDLLDLPFEEIRTDKTRGFGLLPGLIDEYELAGVPDEVKEVNMKNVAASTYIAAEDTTSIATEVFLLMMVHHPEVVRKAQEEIDQYVGSDRLPTYEDRPNLPYIDCIMKEVFRIHPPAPLGIPHKSTQDDVYMGKRIPGGTMLMPNMWQMMRDPKYFSRPEEFDPDRFLEQVKSYETPEQPLNGFYPDDPICIVFGFGRRACPGRYFADMSLWLVIACTLAMFDIKPAIDPKTGLEVLPEIKFTSGLTSHAHPFSCRVIPRSERHARIVSDSLDSSPSPPP